MISDIKKQKQCHFANLLPVSGVFILSTRYDLFFPKRNLMTVAVSNFQISTRCKVWETENICSWKKSCYSFLKKMPKIFPLTWLQSQCILLTALLVLFRLSVLFSNTKHISVILSFSKQCLTGHVQRSTFAIWSKWWSKSCKV